jgi:hypothetical protein
MRSIIIALAILASENVQGHTKPATTTYWKKVKTQLEKT